MQLFIKITFFIVVGSSCAKQNLPKPNYCLERDNKNTVSITSPIKVYQTQYLNSIAGKPFQFNTPGEANVNLYRSFYGNNLATAGITSESKLIVKESFSAYKNPNTNKIVCELTYNNKHYVIQLSRDFSNVTHDLRSLNYYTDFFVFPYLINYTGLLTDTDTITSCGNTLINKTDSLCLLKTCNSIAHYNKPKHYSINFINYEHFFIENKLFLVTKIAANSFYTCP